MNIKEWLKNPKHEPIRDTKAERDLFTRRVVVSVCVLFLMCIVLFLNLYHLQIQDHTIYQTRSNDNRIKLLPLPPARGLIYDRYGRKLAENITFFGLYIVPEKVKNLNDTFAALKPLVGLTDEDIENFNKARRRASRYTPILLKPALTEEQIARFAVNQYKFPSVAVQPYFKRHYIYGEPLTHILGYVGKINERDVERLKANGEFSNYEGTHDIGKQGIERYYEKELHGQVGFEEVEVNSRGKVVRKLEEQPAVAGKSIHLTIDLDLQEYIMNLLGDERAAVVVLDPKDGSVLAMVSTPSYDNNLFVEGISSKDYNALLYNPNRPLYNRATQGAYPPASTVKPFIAVAGLTEKVIDPNKEIFDPGYWYLPNTQKRYRDWKMGGHGKTNLLKAITESSDTYFYQVAYHMGIDRLSEWMKKFGFGESTGIDLKEETPGVMPNREWKKARFKRSWLQGDTIPVGIGQGYWSATPLQVAKALTILVDNGKVHTPHLMKSIDGATVQYYKDPHLYPDITEPKLEYWQDAKEGMYSVINSKHGTARRAFLGTDYKAAGKSGTAQVFSLKENQVYHAKDLKNNLHDHAWFIAFAPYKNPKLVVAAILENAGGGSSHAAPIVRKIMDYYLDVRLPQIAEMQKQKQKNDAPKIEKNYAQKQVILTTNVTTEEKH